jgi:ribonuclease P protein component
MKGEMYLKKTDDFAMVHNQGKWVGNKLIGIKSIPNGLDLSRWGIITSKRLGKAVTRNLIKRRLREIIRGFNLKKGYDIIIIGRAGVINSNFTELKNSVYHLLKQGNLLDIGNEKNRIGND